MTGYVDASAFLAFVKSEPHRLREWGKLERRVTGRLTMVESLRTLDRFFVRGDLGADDVARLRETVFRLARTMRVVEITESVLLRASEPFSTPLGTLDAVHLATALLVRAEETADLAFATHDTELALAARAQGFPVLGI